MDKKLLSILCCPVTHKGLALARPDVLSAVNAAIGAGKLVNHDGAALQNSLKEALVTDDGKTLYPVLLEGEGVALSQLESR